MISSKHLIKTSLAWVNIVYIICFVGVALFPESRIQFVRYAIHADIPLGKNVITIGSFISGLIWWNIMVAFGVWLFVFIYNRIKK